MLKYYHLLKMKYNKTKCLTFSSQILNKRGKHICDKCDVKGYTYSKDLQLHWLVIILSKTLRDSLTMLKHHK